MKGGMSKHPVAGAGVWEDGGRTGHVQDGFPSPQIDISFLSRIRLVHISSTA